ncbi:DUF3332 domain-containing protein [Vibrio chagasii]|nr:DUF3332 domain-containing protein [Vibrio chagasii]
MTTATDYIVFNSIEFWYGKTPHLLVRLTSSIIKVDTMIDVNDSPQTIH